jgi:hypothetical protein
MEGEDLRRGAGGGIQRELVVGLTRAQELWGFITHSPTTFQYIYIPLFIGHYLVQVTITPIPRDGGSIFYTYSLLELVPQG